MQKTWKSDIQLASNLKTSGGTLNRLSHSNDVDVLASLLTNPATPAPTVDALFEKCRKEVCYYNAFCALAASISAPVERQNRLFQTRFLYGTRFSVREIFWRLAENPRTAPDTLESLANHKDVNVRRAVAGRQDTPLSALERLAKDSINDVREAVARNRAVPKDVLAVLAVDGDEWVRAAAKKTLRKTPRRAARAASILEIPRFSSVSPLPDSPEAA